MDQKIQLLGETIRNLEATLSAQTCRIDYLSDQVSLLEGSGSRYHTLPPVVRNNLPLATSERFKLSATKPPPTFEPSTSTPPSPATKKTPSKQPTKKRRRTDPHLFTQKRPSTSTQATQPKISKRSGSLVTCLVLYESLPPIEQPPVDYPSPSRTTPPT